MAQFLLNFFVLIIREIKQSRLGQSSVLVKDYVARDTLDSVAMEMPLIFQTCTDCNVSLGTTQDDVQI